MAILFADSFNGYPTLGVSPAPSGGNVNGWQDMVNAGYEKPGTIGSTGWFSAGVCKNGGKIGNSCRMSLRINTSGIQLDGLPSTEFMLSRKIPAWERFITLNVQMRLTKSYAASGISEKLPLVTLGPITVYAQNAVDAGVSMYNVYVNGSGIVGRFDSSMWHGLEVEVNREAKKLRVYIGNMPVWESDAAEFEVFDFRFRGYLQTSVQHLGYIDLDSLVLQDGSGTKNNARIASLAVTAMQPSAVVQEQFGEKYPVQASLISALIDTSLPTGYNFENSYVSSDVLGVRDLVKTETLPEVFKPLSVVVTTSSRRSEPDSVGIKPVVKYKDLIYKGMTPFNAGAWRTDRYVLDSAPDGANWNGQSVLDLAWGYETVSKAEDLPMVNGGFDYLIFGGAGTILDIYRGDVDPTYINPSPSEYVPGPITIEDSGPGSKVVGKGTRALGYFGVVSNNLVFPTTQLATLFPLTEGTAINDGADWLKFVNGGQVLFISKKPLRTDISWQTLYQAGLVYGVDGTGLSPIGSPVNQLKIVKSGGFKYRLRVVRGADENPSGSLYNVPDPDGYKNSEWTRLLMRCSDQDPSATFWERFTDDDLGHTNGGNTHLSWCYETHPFSVNHRVSRGYPSITGVAASNGTTTEGGGLKMSWRPCLEYIGVDETYVPPPEYEAPSLVYTGNTSQNGRYDTRMTTDNYFYIAGSPMRRLNYSDLSETNITVPADSSFRFASAVNDDTVNLGAYASPGYLSKDSGATWTKPFSSGYADIAFEFKGNIYIPTTTLKEWQKWNLEMTSYSLITNAYQVNSQSGAAKNNNAVVTSTSQSAMGTYLYITWDMQTTHAHNIGIDTNSPVEYIGCNVFFVRTLSAAGVSRLIYVPPTVGAPTLLKAFAIGEVGNIFHVNNTLITRNGAVLKAAQLEARPDDTNASLATAQAYVADILNAMSSLAPFYTETTAPNNVLPWRDRLVSYTTGKVRIFDAK